MSCASGAPRSTFASSPRRRRSREVCATGRCCGCRSRTARETTLPLGPCWRPSRRPVRWSFATAMRRGACSPTPIPTDRSATSPACAIPRATWSVSCPTQSGRRKSSWDPMTAGCRSEEHTSELKSPCNLVCRLLLEKKILPERLARLAQRGRRLARVGLVARLLAHDRILRHGGDLAVQQPVTRAVEGLDLYLRLLAR